MSEETYPLRFKIFCHKFSSGYGLGGADYGPGKDYYFTDEDNIVWFVRRDHIDELPYRHTGFAKTIIETPDPPTFTRWQKFTGFFVGKYPLKKQEDTFKFARWLSEEESRDMVVRVNREARYLEETTRIERATEEVDRILAEHRQYRIDEAVREMEERSILPLPSDKTAIIGSEKEALDFSNTDPIDLVEI